MNPRVLAAAREAGLSFAPGIATPSDIEAALEFDCRLLKFFPAEPSGGLPYLNSIAAPYLHFGIKFCTFRWPQPDQYGLLSAGFENRGLRRFVAGSARLDQCRFMESNYRSGSVGDGHD